MMLGFSEYLKAKKNVQYLIYLGFQNKFHIFENIKVLQPSNYHRFLYHSLKQDCLLNY